MTPSSTHDRVLKVHNLREFFRESVEQAISKQKLSVTDQTAHYVVNLLTLFSRSERFFSHDTGRRSFEPLALLLSRANESRSEEERNSALQRLGDMALFVSGFFSQSIEHSAVDRGYYADMGGHAYEWLSNNIRGTLRGRTFGHVFSELSDSFVNIVDVLNEISEQNRVTSAQDAMRLYKTWKNTGSRRAARLLKELGIATLPTTNRCH